MINNFVKIVTMPYDGNVYRTPNSKVYIRKDLISRINQSDFIKKNNIDENLLFKNEKSDRACAVINRRRASITILEIYMLLS